MNKENTRSGDCEYCDEYHEKLFPKKDVFGKIVWICEECCVEVEFIFD